jgi:hypothetical protein
VRIKRSAQRRLVLSQGRTRWFSKSGDRMTRPSHRRPPDCCRRGHAALSAGADFTKLSRRAATRRTYPPRPALSAETASPSRHRHRERTKRERPPPWTGRLSRSDRETSTKSMLACSFVQPRDRFAPRLTLALSRPRSCGSAGICTKGAMEVHHWPSARLSGCLGPAPWAWPWRSK